MDYHNNVNSDIFIKQEKIELYPLLKTQQKKTVLFIENTPYSHKCDIGSLASLIKTKLVELMITYDVEYIDLPSVTQKQIELLDSDMQYYSDINPHFLQ